MNKKLIALTAAFAVVGVFSTVNMLATRAYGQEKDEASAPQAKGDIHHYGAKITPWAAMKTAAEKTGGMPFQALYEFDEGHWVYGVVIVKDHKLMEVEIDPQTGKVGDTEAIDPAGEAKEVQQELTAATKLGN